MKSKFEAAPLGFDDYASGVWGFSRKVRPDNPKIKHNLLFVYVNESLVKLV